MYYATAQVRQTNYQKRQTLPQAAISCDWAMLQAQLLEQWNRLTARELDKTGRDRHLIALLIERRYGIRYQLVENYLRNFERTMPLAA
jgi:hypothetical protein